MFLRICHRPFRTLPSDFFFFFVKFAHKGHILGLIFVIFELCSLTVVAGLLEYFSEKKTRSENLSFLHEGTVIGPPFDLVEGQQVFRPHDRQI